MEHSIDREKVIEGLQKIIDDDWVWKHAICYASIISDAVKLLKEQDTDAEIEGGGMDWWYVCGECRAVIDSSDSYCSKCGRRIRWKRLGGDE